MTGLNMEVKKDALSQKQDGIWKLSLTVHPNDMPIDLMVAPMGTRYALAMIPIEDEQTANPEKSIVTKPETNCDIVTEKTEGEKLRQRACILCGERKFQEYMCFKNDICERGARQAVLDYCEIESRKELVTNEDAQKKFGELMIQYRKHSQPPIEEQYEDNIDRY